jgi:hypothetical protein
MSHAALIALMNNQTFTPSVNEILEDITIFANHFLELALYYAKALFDLYIELITKYSNDKYYIALSSFLLIIYAGISIVEHYMYLCEMRETSDQIQYLKKKNVILQGNLEFLLDNNVNNGIKIARLTKQLKKLQKEINEYA